jgi:hypothetical protein
MAHALRKEPFMRTSPRRLSFFLVALATLGLAELSRTSDAGACSPIPQSAPSAPLMVAIDPAVSFPKDAGLVLMLRATIPAPNAAPATFQIEVRSGSTVLEGAWRPLELTSSTGAYRPWHWQPTAKELPVGVLTVHVKLDGSTETADSPVTIADRRFVVPAVPITFVTASRVVTDQPGAPVITCSKPASVGDCGNNSDGFYSIATRHTAVPLIAYEHELLRGSDALYLRESWSVYGRNADGSIGAADRREIDYRTPSRLDHAYPQYCAELTTRSIVDGTTVKTEACTPHGALDLSFSDAENEATVKSGLAGCTATVYPEGTSADDPTGTSSSGCSASPRPLGGGSLGLCGLVLGLAAMTLRRRRAA